MRVNLITKAGLLAAVVLALTFIKAAQAEEYYTVPAGTIIPLKIDTLLRSDQSRAGGRFTATVFRNVEMYGRALIPAGSKVEGRVTAVTGTSDRAGAGSIAVALDRLVLPGGTAVTIEGTLTTLNLESRRRLEGDAAAAEGGYRRRQAVVFVGQGDGAGALIGVLSPGGETVLVGSDAGGQVLTGPPLPGEGDRSAEVKSGAEFGLRVERPFTVSATSIKAAGVNSGESDHHHHQEFNPQPGGFSPNADSVRFAKLVLRDLGYYAGEINGEVTEGARVAIGKFQHDRKLPATGGLDLQTSRALGVASADGDEGVPVRIDTATAKPGKEDSIDVTIAVHAQGSRWQVFTTHFVMGNTLHVYVRGGTPHGVSTGAAGQQVAVTYNNLPGVSRVVFHDGQREVVAELSGGVR